MLGQSHINLIFQLGGIPIHTQCALNKIRFINKMIHKKSSHNLNSIVKSFICHPRRQTMGPMHTQHDLKSSSHFTLIGGYCWTLFFNRSGYTNSLFFFFSLCFCWFACVRYQLSIIYGRATDCFLDILRTQPQWLSCDLTALGALPGSLHD